MDLLFPDNGLVYQLSQILNTNVIYRLFVNNVMPSLNDTLATYTEATFAGYASVPQNWTNFTINGISNHQGYALAPPIAFNNASGSAQNVYGYFVTDNANTKLVAVARFDGAPISIPNGGSYQVVPTWGDFSLLAS